MAFSRFGFVLLLSAGILTLTCSAASAKQERNRLVQPSLYDSLDKASVLFTGGQINEAVANTDLVLMKDAVKVSIDVSGARAGRHEAAYEAAIGALDMWEDALDGGISFEVVPPEQAQVRITYEDGKELGGDEPAGQAIWSRQVLSWTNGVCSASLSGEVSLRTELRDGTPLSDGAMKHTAGHEMGHILGLTDSYRQGDLMGPLDPRFPVTKPTEREVSALKEVRSEASSMLQSALLARARFGIQ